MKPITHIRASVLATVLVVAMLLLLSVLGLLALWESDSRLYARLTYQRNQRAHLESAFILYEHLESFSAEQDSAGAYCRQLYDSLPDSRVYLERKPWGLYEIVTAVNHDRRMWSLRLAGAAQPWTTPCTFYYSGRNFSFTLSGNSNLKGKALLPKTGVQYGQFESRFFEGEKLQPSQIGLSADSLPPPTVPARLAVDSLFALRDQPGLEALDTDSLNELFYRNPPRVLALGSGTLSGCRLSGNLILVADELSIDSTCHLENLLIVARSLTLEPGFRGSLQVFASDSVRVAERVVLQAPSGIFLHKSDEKHHVSLAPASEVNGYVIVDDRRVLAAKPTPDVHYRQAPTAIVRGLVYVNGTAQWQGLVSGAVFLQRALHVSTFGRYQDFAYRATVLENRTCAYPHWLATPYPKKTIAWTH